MKSGPIVRHGQQIATIAKEPLFQHCRDIYFLWTLVAIQSPIVYQSLITSPPFVQYQKYFLHLFAANGFWLKLKKRRLYDLQGGNVRSFET